MSTPRYDRSVPGQKGMAPRGVALDCLRHERLSRVQKKMRITMSTPSSSLSFQPTLQHRQGSACVVVGLHQLSLQQSGRACG